MKIFWTLITIAIISLIIYTLILFIGIRVKRADLKDRINTELTYEGTAATEEKLRDKMNTFLDEKNIHIPYDNIQINADWTKLIVKITYPDSIILFNKFKIYKIIFTVEDTVYFNNQ